jgi:hypothetical protein
VEVFGRLRNKCYFPECMVRSFPISASGMAQSASGKHKLQTYLLDPGYDVCLVTHSTQDMKKNKVICLYVFQRPEIELIPLNFPRARQNT